MLRRSSLASDPKDAGGPGAGRRRSWPDLILGLVTLPCVALLYAESLTFRKMDWEPLGMAFWPQVVLIGLAILAGWFILRGLKHSRVTEPLRALALVPWLAGIVFLAVLPWLGTYVAGFAFVAALTFYLHPAAAMDRTKVALANGAVSLALIHLIFAVILGLRMPTGVLGI